MADQITNKFTVLTSGAVTTLQNSDANNAYQFLVAAKNGLPRRTLWDVLQKCDLSRVTDKAKSPEEQREDVVAAAVKGILSADKTDQPLDKEQAKKKENADKTYDPDDTEQAKKKENAAKKKATRWLKASDVNPQDIEEVFGMAFGLKLSEEDANELFLFMTGSLIHYLEPRCLVLAYGLRKGMSYREASKLADSLLEKHRLTKLDNGDAAEHKPDTVLIYEEEQVIQSEEQLESFLEEHRQDFTSVHRGSQEVLNYLLGFLPSVNTVRGEGDEKDNKKDNAKDNKKDDKKDNAKGDKKGNAKDDKKGNAKDDKKDVPKERYQSLTRATATYLAEVYFPRALPNAQKGTELRDVQDLINQGWPSDRNQLTRMMAGNTSVSRKLLLLLFIYTIESVEEKTAPWQRDKTMVPSVEDVFSYRYKKLSSILTACGMSPPDPRNVFDWIILFSLTHADLDGLSTDKLDELLDMIF